MYLLQFVTIQASVLLAHVETGQTPEERVAVIKVITH